MTELFATYPQTLLKHGVRTLGICALMGTLVSVTGCGRMAVADRSLEYQDAKLLPPLTMPEGQSTRDRYPLYQVPDKGAANVVPLTNAKGNRYQLPRATTPNVPNTANTTGNE